MLGHRFYKGGGEGEADKGKKVFQGSLHCAIRARCSLSVV